MTTGTTDWWADESTIRRFSGVEGTELWARDAGEGPVVVLTHGFPELGFSWRHQLDALVDAGYRVLIPDQRGYGRSGRPDEVTDYDLEHLVGDVVALLDDVGAETAAIVGHDWGSIVAWNSPLLQPDRFWAVAGLSVPFTPRSKRPPTEIWRELFGDRYFYILDFQEPGRADANLGRDALDTMHRLLAPAVGQFGGDPSDPGILGGLPDDRGFVDRLPGPGPLPAWLTEDELAFYAGEFGRTGFTGGINWYRNFDRNWDHTAHLADATISIPSFFLAGGADPVAQGIDLERMEASLLDHRGNVIVPDAGHWVQQEAAAEVNAALVDFLDGARSPAT